MRADRLRLPPPSAFASEDNYAGHATPLARRAYTQALSSPPEQYFKKLLEHPKPTRQIDAFGGQFTVNTADLANWKMIWGMGLASEKTIASNTLTPPWTQQPNGPEKWFDPLLITMWAIQWTRQNDRATMDALIKRLSYADDPLFITSLVIGTLSAISGERHAYDRKAWQIWWQNNRDAWPKR